jgi:TRAP-type C4-dicarboxylate transport system permease small subunit
MITLFITLAIIGWVVSLTFAIKTIIEGWRYKNKEVFDGGLSMFGLSIPFGLVLGWVLLVLMIKTKYIDKHFE